MLRRNGHVAGLPRVCHTIRTARERMGKGGPSRARRPLLPVSDLPALGQVFDQARSLALLIPVAAGITRAKGRVSKALTPRPLARSPSPAETPQAAASYRRLPSRHVHALRTRATRFLPDCRADLFAPRDLTAGNRCLRLRSVARARAGRTFYLDPPTALPGDNMNVTLLRHEGRIPSTRRCVNGSGARRPVPPDRGRIGTRDRTGRRRGVGSSSKHSRTRGTIGNDVELNSSDADAARNQTRGTQTGGDR
jgi:hypothetical protein